MTFPSAARSAAHLALMSEPYQPGFLVFFDHALANQELDDPHQVFGQGTSRMSIASLEYGSNELGMTEAIRVRHDEIQHQDLQSLRFVVLHGKILQERPRLLM